MVFNYSLSAEQLDLIYQAGRAGHPPNVLSSTRTSTGDTWSCEVTPNDGYSDGTSKTSSSVQVLSSVPPTTDTPYITPDPAYTFHNLTCNANNTYASGNPFHNITSWYKSGKPYMQLYLPFEGNGNELHNVTDYSGNGFNGSVYQGDWNRTGGIVGGAYPLNG